MLPRAAPAPAPDTLVRRSVAPPQYRTVLKTLDLTDQQLAEFKTTYVIDKCRRANARFAAGVPATQEHGQLRAASNDQAMDRILGLCEEFFSLLDKLELYEVSRRPTAAAPATGILPDPPLPSHAPSALVFFSVSDERGGPERGLTHAGYPGDPG